MKTRLEISAETAAFYNLGNRSQEGDVCLYNGPDGKRCAFGRMCVPGEPKEETGLKPSMLLQYLKPEYAGHSYEFYKAIQLLHDYKDNWTETGLSDYGKMRVEDLKKKWA